FILDIVYYWTLVGVFYMYDYRNRYREQERTAAELALKASRLEGSLARANLETLRMQLNPHFLFNTLNAISVLALKGERQNVVRMLTRLSDLLRLALENADQVVPLAEELAFLEPYLEIEQVRFRDRLDVIQDVPAEVLDAEVPSLLLQPIVENAVRHGIARCTGPGTIEIRALTADGRLVIEVRDSGPGFAASAADSEGHGVGIANTRARLEQLYGPEHRLELVNGTRGGAIVRVVIPFRTFRYDGETSTGSLPADPEARTA
ncbi:MAG: sensor histidine kinase, partial [Longimicrobiales bacterium]